MKLQKKISAVILAGGDSTRFGENKMLVMVSGKPLIVNTVAQFDKSDCVDEIIVCTKADLVDIFRELLCFVQKPIKIVVGGGDRHKSTLNGLLAASGDYVLIHDGARCFVSTALIERVANAISDDVGVIPTLAVNDSVVMRANGAINYLDRANIKSVQTPQGFSRTRLLDIYLSNDVNQLEYTDNGGIWQTKYLLKEVEGDAKNIKITHKSDIKSDDFRIGNGYDLHQLVPGRRLILGGLQIPHDKGLLGHSDADVVIHALMDALLSSVGLPDIGVQFPASDNTYKDIDSTILLKKVLELLKQKGYKPKQVCVAILAEKPKLVHYLPQMQIKIAELCNLSPSNVGITATTTEKVGLVGREQAIAAYAKVLVEKL